ncbi:hypothetical protein [Pseudoruegeria sp. HB172150]|uniref:hypothetical protein n=1 Tax=Pseudoruegeria sp. HB172150 TaxID=2721164 RepID=UPI001C12FBCB|nr:hypothetical protein [Pseudoruegeria sp. HB172150]
MNHGYDEEALRLKWGAIYALCQPSELDAEEHRLDRELQALAEQDDLGSYAHRLNSLRQSLLRQRRDTMRRNRGL